MTMSTPPTSSSMRQNGPPNRIVRMATPSPDLKGRALVVIDAQNEFLSEKGNFPCPHDESTKPLINKVNQLAPEFRSRGGKVVWVKAHYPNRDSEPEDMAKETKGTDEWLTAATHVYHNPCCEEGTFGAEIHADMPFDEEKDAVVIKHHYSAFHRDEETGQDSALLELLKREKITHAYFCGVASGTCVLATVLDAVKLRKDEAAAAAAATTTTTTTAVVVVPEPIVVLDCLGYRRKDNHEDAIYRMERMAEFGQGSTARRRSTEEEEQPDLKVAFGFSIMKDPTGARAYHRPMK